MATIQELQLNVKVDAEQLSALSEGFSKLEKIVQNTAKTLESFSTQFDNIADNALQAADKIAEEVPRKVEDDLVEEFGTVPEAVYGKSQLNNTQRLSIIEAWL
ncbi:MAG: hypothetical protein IH874_03860 [Candidatus Dadabacteria bacterium]|nr:hypothetical protein [Candidatus Dadabacteria bacterium]